MPERFKRRIPPWIGLFCILFVYAVSIFRLKPQVFFGITEDDSLYFSSAQAIANHEGYVLPSVPGQPAATKYPILYAWMLSWVWRANSSFPSNLTEAVGLTAGFGAIFLICSFLFLRQLDGINDSAALLLTLVTALHPAVRLYSASVMSDIPFAAFALLAMLLADRAMRPEAANAKALGCGVLAGLSILLRIFGVPVALGIFAAGVGRRAWRQTAIFSAVLVPFAGTIVWRAIHPQPPIPMGSESALRGPGFLEAWTYYTSYIGFWRLSVPNAHIFWTMLKNNLTSVVIAPSNYFLFPLVKGNTVENILLMVVVSGVVWAGMVRQAKRSGWRAIHWVLPFYITVVLFWNFPLTRRFLVLFLPFFAAGFWFEIRRVLTLIHAAVDGSRVRSQKIPVLTIGLGVATLLCILALNYVHGTRDLLATERARSTLLREKREAYQWLSCCTSAGDVVIAYEDASLYLYSGRESMRPFAFTTAAFYDPAYVQQTGAHVDDVPHAISARYWLIASDDFGIEGNANADFGRLGEAQVERTFPEVFRSQNGNVRIYALK